MVIPETIDGCLSLLKDIEKGGVYAIPQGAREDWNHVRRQMTKLCAPRLRHLLSIVAEVSPNGSESVPNTTVSQLKEYIEFCERNVKQEHPYDSAIRYVNLKRRTSYESATFEYERGEDGGFPIFWYITIPTEWLTCEVGQLRKKVLADMFVGLSKHLDRLEQEVNERMAAKGRVFAALCEYMSNEEINALVKRS